MKNTLVGKKVQEFKQKNLEKRLHNLMGQWNGKKTKITSTKGESRLVKSLHEKLTVSTDLAFQWEVCKSGLIKFKNNYTKLIFHPSQIVNQELRDSWEIKKLTFTKLVLLRRSATDNQLTEYHFRRAFDGYNKG